MCVRHSLTSTPLNSWHKQFVNTWPMPDWLYIQLCMFSHSLCRAWQRTVNYIQYKHFKKEAKGSGAEHYTPPVVHFTCCQQIWCASHYSFTSGQDPLLTLSLLRKHDGYWTSHKYSQLSETFTSTPSGKAHLHAQQSAVKEHILTILNWVSISVYMHSSGRNIHDQRLFQNKTTNRHAVLLVSTVMTQFITSFHRKLLPQGHRNITWTFNSHA